MSKLLCSLLLIMLFFVQSGIASEVAQATYTFGNIEILKHDSKEWEFLRRGVLLSGGDIIRTPPVSLLRLKLIEDNVEFPAFFGSREMMVSQFIATGRKRARTPNGRRLNADIDGTTAIDILPTGEHPKKRPEHKHKKVPRITPTELQRLRTTMSNFDDKIKKFAETRIADIPKAGKGSPFDVYPGRNILIAQRLFSTIPKAEENLFQQQMPDSTGVQALVLYGQLLRSVGVESDLVTNSKGEPFLIFSSSMKQPTQITANRELIYLNEREQTDYCWIPISDMKGNITRAWYKGSKLASEPEKTRK